MRGDDDEAPRGADDDEGRTRRRIGLLVGLLALALIATVPSALTDVPGYGRRPALAAGVAALMAIWWLTEALPIAWTACVPLVAYPLLGVHGSGLVGGLERSAVPYGDAYIFMFLGGMAIGAAMEQRSLHKRVALLIMRAIGTSPERLLAGLIVSTGVVSMWISNTATAVMMVPIALALLRQIEAAAGKKATELGTALLLSVAYAANVGGIGTKVGSGTNSIFCGFAADRLGVDIGFVQYLLLGLPFVIVFLPVVHVILWRHGKRSGVTTGPARNVLDEELGALGPLAGHERVVAIVFALTAGLWVAGDWLRPLVAPLARAHLGLAMQGKHWEAAVALVGATTLLLTRSLSFRALLGIPWGTLLLLGGSFSMAAGIEAGGFGAVMTEALRPVATLPFAVQALLATSATVFLTALASNTAAVNVALNVLPPNLALLSTTVLGASCDFALPAGTPPNAIVFGSGAVRLPVMMRIGVTLDLLAVAAVTLYVVVYAQRLF